MNQDLDGNLGGMKITCRSGVARIGNENKHRLENYMNLNNLRSIDEALTKLLQTHVLLQEENKKLKQEVDGLLLIVRDRADPKPPVPQTNNKR